VLYAAPCCVWVGSRPDRHVVTGTRFYFKFVASSFFSTVRLLRRAYRLDDNKREVKIPFPISVWIQRECVSILVGGNACGAQPWTARLIADIPSLPPHIVHATHQVGPLGLETDDYFVFDKIKRTFRAISQLTKQPAVFLKLTIISYLTRSNAPFAPSLS
jgi:hypothetical protein